MAFPLIPFIAGAVIGSLATYIYRDDKIRHEIKRSAGDLSSKVQHGAEEVSDKLTGRFDRLRGQSGTDKKTTETDGAVAETDDEKPVTATPKRKVTRKATPKKSAEDKPQTS